MHPISQPTTSIWPRHQLWQLTVLSILSALLLLLAACGPESGAGSDAVDLEGEALRIASEFGQSGDASRARIELQTIDVANPSHWLLFLTEEYINRGDDPGGAQALVQLTIGLGLQSRLVTEYAQQHNLLATAPEPVFEVVEPSESNVIALEPAPREPAVVAQEAAPSVAEANESNADVALETVELETVEEAEPSADAAPIAEAPVPEAAPVNPMVQASNELNVRGGPGTNYAVVGALSTGAQADIVARNPQGDWWQVSLAGGQQGWVYGPLVTTSGDTSTIAVAANIPAPPPPTPAPVAQAPPVQEAAPPPAQEEAPPAEPEAQPEPEPQSEPEQPQEEAPPAEQPAEGWSVSTRLRPVGQDAQRCAGGGHNIFVTVLDANGSHLNGVRVKEVFTGSVKETGGSGPGMTHWDIYRGGGGQVQLVDEGGNPISPISEGMSADWPAFHMMYEAGYCNCKPHPDAASCEADLNNKTYFFAVGHYTYEVVFRRNH